MSTLQPTSRIDWELSKQKSTRFVNFWKERAVIPTALFQSSVRVWVEIGAGTGGFFSALSERNPSISFVAMERCRHRAKRLVSKSQRMARPNFLGIRGNAIPAMLHSVPDNSLERVYILYPCPWVKNSQRKNRWYLHPMMPHLLRTLKPGGLLIWASDQKFYIDEARYVCEKHYQTPILVHGEISPNEFNDLASFDGGRTKFESDFLGQGLPCYELVVRKPETAFGTPD